MTGGEKRVGSPAAAQLNEGNGDQVNAGIEIAKKVKLDQAEKPACAENGKDANGKSQHLYVKQQDSVRTETSSEAVHGIDEKSAQDLVEKIYGTKMPKDFVDFWDFCCRTNPMNPRMALSALNLELVGPFDFLARDVVVDSSLLEELQKQALIHWRYFYDVPEVQTCLKNSGNSQLHYGYFRYFPSDLPAFVVSSDPEKNCKLHDVGSNLFAVVHKIATDAVTSAEQKEKPALKELLEVITLHAEKFGHSIGDAAYIRHHLPTSVAEAPYGLGLPSGKHHIMSFAKKHHLSHAGMNHILADYNDHENEEDLHVEADKKLQDLEYQIESDRKEGNYGTTLELGLALFCNGNRHFNKRAAHLLTTAYKLFGKDKFSEIAQEHLHHRSRGNQLGRFVLKGI